jgi:uncharacterized membrane protein
VLPLLVLCVSICHTDLIALVTVYDGVIATIGVLCVDQGLPDTSTFDKHTFYTVVAITAFGATFARLLYQRALSIAPLSLTVPYLAFTPAFVVLISPLFLAGEAASPMGMLGEHCCTRQGAQQRQKRCWHTQRRIQSARSSVLPADLVKNSYQSLCCDSVKHVVNHFHQLLMHMVSLCCSSRLAGAVGS